MLLGPDGRPIQDPGPEKPAPKRPRRQGGNALTKTRGTSAAVSRDCSAASAFLRYT